MVLTQCFEDQEDEPKHPGFPRPPPSGSLSLPSLRFPSIHSIHIIHFVQYKSTYAIFKRFRKSRFSHGFVNNSINFLITELDSLLSYQVVEEDLLVCMPAVGDCIKAGFYEIDNMLI